MAKKASVPKSPEETYKTLKALYFSGKVKPTLNKLLVEIEAHPENIDFKLLACEALVRGKDYDKLSSFADDCIKLDPNSALAHYFKSIAFHNTKGKEQEAIKKINEALSIEPNNMRLIKAKADTHLDLFNDYHLPIKLAEKHGDKGQDCLLKITSLIEEIESPTYHEYLMAADVSIIIKRNMDAKKYYLRGVNAFDKTDEAEQDMNIFKELSKAQKACSKLIAKFTE